VWQASVSVVILALSRVCLADDEKNDAMMMKMHDGCRRFVAGMLVAIVVWLTVYGAFFDVLPNQCTEFSESPVYTRIPVRVRSSSSIQVDRIFRFPPVLIDSYRLYRVDDASEPRPAHQGLGLPVVFVHGHRGSYDQSKPFAAFARSFRGVCVCVCAYARVCVCLCICARLCVCLCVYGLISVAVDIFMCVVVVPMCCVLLHFAPSSC
jgi:hypothetical protein